MRSLASVTIIGAVVYVVWGGAVATAAAQASWAAIHLHPQGLGTSQILACSGPSQGGWTLDNTTHAALWSGSASSYVQLPYDMDIHGMDGAALVGISYASPQGAVLLPAGGAGLIGLAPQGAVQSQANAIRANEQVGWARLQISPGVYRTHASLWHGSVASWVDLNPPGMYESRVYATDGVKQGGGVTTSSLGFGYPALWSGTASSVVDMTPLWATPGYGGIAGMVFGQQVGSAVVGGAAHATIWSGTAASAIDVNSFPGLDSGLFATTGAVQVGQAHVPGLTFPVAGVWLGTAASFVNLQDFLPAGYVGSVATSVAEYDGRIIVGGYAQTFDHSEAFIWTHDIPAPGTLPALGLSALVASRRRRVQDRR